MLENIVAKDFFKDISNAFLRVVGGIIGVFLLFKLINYISKKIEKKLDNNPKVDTTVNKFVTPLIRKILKFFIVVSYVGFIGIETTSIAAAITSAGLAIGLALQGSLSNFAGGFVILIMRPFKVGDYIQTCGESGTVENIQVFYTTLITFDNRVIKIPNGQVASSIIVDDTTKSIRRVSLVFSIGHNNDYSLVKKIISKCVERTGLKLKNTSTFINVTSSGNFGMEISVRVWCKVNDYWDLYFMLLENIKLEFDKHSITPPHSMVKVTINKQN